jgi:hypothetical protein
MRIEYFYGEEEVFYHFSGLKSGEYSKRKHKQFVGKLVFRRRGKFAGLRICWKFVEF